MISPLDRGHRGGTLSITSSRVGAVGAAVGRTTGTLGSALATAAEGSTITEPAEGPAEAGPARTGPVVEGPTTPAT